MLSVRHNPGVKKKMCLEDFVRVTLRILLSSSSRMLVSAFFAFTQQEKRKYGSFSFVLFTFVFAFWATRVYRFSNHFKDAQRFWMQTSQATTVASMEGRRDGNFELRFLFSQFRRTKSSPTEASGPSERM